ncbi:hypothetical protein PUN28_007065 [Cardiocondyla obscurior]|uniref:Uncharacterized protein n=1 Tax=Cardiocondyla obscurior TaxID=286306 RepID=A0AAW2G395_9HYME
MPIFISLSNQSLNNFNRFAEYYRDKQERLAILVSRRKVKRGFEGCSSRLERKGVWQTRRWKFLFLLFPPLRGFSSGRKVEGSIAAINLYQFKPDDEKRKVVIIAFVPKSGDRGSAPLAPDFA